MDLLLGLRERQGTTVVLGTHDPQVAARCDRVVRLLDGRIAEDIAVREQADAGGTAGRLARPAAG